MKPPSVRDAIAENHPDVLFADGDGFDGAILGVIERVGQPAFVVYDAQKIIECLMRDGLSEEEAWEHFAFNITGAWVGPNTPGFLRLVGRPPAER